MGVVRAQNIEQLIFLDVDAPSVRNVHVPPIRLRQSRVLSGRQHCRRVEVNDEAAACSLRSSVDGDQPADILARCQYQR